MKATDAAGNTGVAASYTWTIDTSAPTASITASPTNPSNSSSPSFSFTSEAGATFTCALDTPTFSSCASPKSYSAVADGSHTFQVKATDTAGNTGTAASYTWTVDTAAPTASISASPTNPSNSSSPSFSFTSEAGASFTCALDGAAFAGCSSPKSYTGVADGSHTFQVKATDAAGNTSAAASYTWTIDTAAATATITASPTNPSNSASPSFSFTSEAGASFTCALDGGAFAGCSSPTSYTSVADGSHTFQVKATDAAGNTGAAASYTWTVDTSAPTATITTSPTNPSNSASPSFSFTSEAGATFTCALDGAAFAGCSSPKSYASVADGSHTFQVKATDAAGNTGAAASYTWTIDTVAPVATITASPTNPSNSASPSFSFSSEAGATFTCALDGAAFTSCSSPKSYASVADGSHTFQVKATDTAGNTGAIASFTWTVDTVAPTTSITASPTNPSNNASPSFSFSSEAGATFTCALDGAAFAGCSSPKSYASVADGSHTFQVKATDAAGNTGAAASYTWTIDTAAPTATITASPTNPSNNASPSFSFSSEAGATFTCALDGAAFAGCSSPKSYTGVADGSHTFQVKATDAAGNTGAAASYTWTIDTVAPAATISASPTNPSNSAGPSFSFSSEAGATFTCALDGAAFASCSSPKSYAGVADGSHTFQVKATDTAGNTGAAASYTWTIDTIAPAATITASPTNPSNSASPSFSFSSEAGASFQCALDSTFTSCGSPKSYSGLADGTHTFQVKATDAAGNTGAIASFTWTVDTVAPSASITASPTNPSNSASPNFSFSSEAGASFTCALDGAAFASCSSPKSYAGVADGSHTFQVKGDRRGRQRRRSGELHLDDRHGRSDGDDHCKADESEQQRQPELQLHVRGGRDVHLRAGRRRLRRLQLAEELRRRGRWQPHLPGEGDRRRRQHRRGRELHLDGRHQRPDCEHLRQPDESEQQRQPELQLHFRGRRDVHLRPRRRGVRKLQLAEELRGRGRRHPHLPGEGDRRCRQHRRRRQLHLDDRHGRADGDDHRQSDESEQQRQPELQLHLRGGRDVHLRPRRRRLRELREPEELHEPDRRQPYLPGEGDRRRREHRRCGQLHVDDRHGRADGDDHRQPDEPEQQRQPELQLHLRGRRDVHLLARRRRLRELREPEELHEPDQWQPYLPGQGDRHGRQHRRRGQLHLDGRHGRAGLDDHGFADEPDIVDERKLLVHLDRDGLDLPVRARRRRVRSLHDPEGLQRPRSGATPSR